VSPATHDAACPYPPTPNPLAPTFGFHNWLLQPYEGAPEGLDAAPDRPTSTSANAPVEPHAGYAAPFDTPPFADLLALLASPDSLPPAQPFPPLRTLTDL
jgi:hypothetical protein